MVCGAVAHIHEDKKSSLLGGGDLSLQHELGYCAMYGDCGKQSMFGSSLPCSNYTKAQKPSKELTDLLHKVCGDDFAVEDGVCCTIQQAENLESNLKRVVPLISSCPACHRNFFDFFCKFTCSPNQASFIDVVGTAESIDTKQQIVTELNQYVSEDTAQAFYDSCKEIKFLATNGYAMDLIGGGAKNYKEFLKFIGDKKPLLGGSPFQINFRYNLTSEEADEGLSLREDSMKPCNDPDYKCACSDCESSCPQLPGFKNFHQKCTVGAIPCFSFFILMLWLCFIVLLGGFHIYMAQQRKEYDRLNSIGGFDDDESVIMNPRRYSYVLLPKKNLVKEKLTEIQRNLIIKIETFFGKVGYNCAMAPRLTLLTSLGITLILSLGLMNLNFETNPVGLWVSPNEKALHEKQYFEENFGEWYRIEQLIVSTKNDTPVLTWDTLQWWFAKELELNELNGVALDDLCFKPLGDTCAIESFTQYFDGNIDYLSEANWKQKLVGCTSSPVTCLPSFQQPLPKNLLFDRDNVLDARAFIVTVLVNSYSDDVDYTNSAVNYEHGFIAWVRNIRTEMPHLNIAFSAEVSLEEELNQLANSDVRIIIVSYLFMFIYASIALGGKLPTSLETLRLSRFVLGLAGIFIIILSVSASAGFFAIIGLKSTLIIAEVIPFLVLAIGIDNVFLIVHELKLVTLLIPNDPIPHRIYSTLSNVGPSCFLSAILQVLMFLLATSVQMPAVKNFAYYSAGAVFVNFLLQMTAFISLLSLDTYRLENGSLSLFGERRIALTEDSESSESPSASASTSASPSASGSASASASASASGSVFESYINGTSQLNEQHQEICKTSRKGFVQKFIATTYGPWLLKSSNRKKILTFFVMWLGISLALLPQIELGLDQRLAVPNGSYLINYFNSVYEYLNVGPPVFFVVRDFNVTDRSNQQMLCGKFPSCEEFSLSNILQEEYERLEQSFISQPISNWLDDFLNYLNPDLDECCRVKKLAQDEFCLPHLPSRQCQACFADKPFDTSKMEGFPQGKEFMNYFKHWITEPSDPCPLGGKAPYSSSIQYNDTTIETSYFRSAHVPLRSQNDFIVALKNAKRIIKEIKEYLPQLEIFAFSPFYVFFVQYENILSLLFTLMGAAIVVIWLVSALLLGTYINASILVITVISILVDIAGIMAVWNISLNAVSLVNLVICTGLAVEFTIHITKLYTRSHLSFSDTNEEVMYENFMHGTGTNVRVIKLYNSLITTGGTVFTGITLTKLIGISVLAFTRLQIFEVYYFRMWLLLIVIAALHALILLPVLLAEFGTTTTIIKDRDELERNLNSTSENAVQSLRRYADDD